MQAPILKPIQCRLTSSLVSHVAVSPFSAASSGATALVLPKYFAKEACSGALNFIKLTYPMYNSNIIKASYHSIVPPPAGVSGPKL